MLIWFALILPLIGAAARAQTLTTLYSFSGSTPGTDYRATTADLMISGSTLFGVTIAYDAEPYEPGCGVYSLPVTGGSATSLLAFTASQDQGYRGYTNGSVTLSGSTLYGMTRAAAPTTMARSTSFRRRAATEWSSLPSPAPKALIPTEP